MNAQQSEDGTTQATITVDGEEVKGISGFSVSLDIMQMGDPFSLTVPNPRGKWTKKLTPGKKIELHLQNPNVSGGKKTLMHTGRIIAQDISCELGAGTVIQLQCADLGWHIMNEYPKPHERLEERTYGDLLDWATQESTWGIKGVTADSETSRKIRLSQAGGRAVAEAAASDSLIIFQAQVEAGMSLGAMLVMYAKRFNKLVNMSPDGYIQIFEPNYRQKPKYRLDLHEFDDPDSVRNNLLSAGVTRSVETRYSKVTVVGQIVGYSLYDPYGYNPGKFLGYAEAKGDDAPPFKHEFSKGDGEVYDPKWAPYAAGWELKRGLFDAFEARVKVRGHWQRYGGTTSWWISDTIAECHLDPLGIDGNFYVSSVRLNRDRGGDTTDVTLRKKDLLSANFINVVTGKVG